MSQEREKDLSQIYSFMESLYPANLQVRWGKTPHMSTFAEQEEIDRFVKKTGKFESVPGHVWATVVLWMQLRRVMPHLNRNVNSEDVYERLSTHDIGETITSDTSVSLKIKQGTLDENEAEREGYIELVSVLPQEEQERLIRWFDEFENENGKDIPLEALVARWLDNLQGDHFALVYGNNLSESSKIIEGVIKVRSALRARQLINYLFNEGEIEAAKEVEEVARFHIEEIRKKGVRLDLSELGF